ncbi:MAG TPA: hypothetical protein VGS19_08605 [Streptosporangiaceae bacterium]|nr:hypothetical protein [Streptosporangiaceae bacterium]
MRARHWLAPVVAAGILMVSACTTQAAHLVPVHSGPVITAGPALVGHGGQGWTIQGTANSPGKNTQTQLYSVSCPTTRFCMAAGVSAKNSNGPAVVERWDHGAWTLERLTSPGNAISTGLNTMSVSCASPSDCMAVGQGGDLWEAYAWHWDGSGWSSTGIQAPGGLMAVSCPSPGECVVVGDKNASSDTIGNWFAEQWNGSGWQMLATSPDSASLGLSALSCVSANDCMAVGVAGDLGGKPLAEHWDGQTWTPSNPPMPHGLDQGDLTGVSCSSTVHCVAVGSTQGEGPSPAYAVAWDGTSWHLLPGMPDAADSSISQVSCPQVTRCVAVGYVQTAGGNIDKVAADTWNGTGWTAASLSYPDIDYTELAGVSCVAATFCETAGFYGRSNGPQLSLVEGHR